MLAGNIRAAYAPVDEELFNMSWRDGAARGAGAITTAISGKALIAAALEADRAKGPWLHLRRGGTLAGVSQAALPAFRDRDELMA